MSDDNRTEWQRRIEIDVAVDTTKENLAGISNKISVREQKDAIARQRDWFEAEVNKAVTGCDKKMEGSLRLYARGRLKFPE